MTLKIKIAAISVIILGGSALIWLVLSYDERPTVTASTGSTLEGGQAKKILKQVQDDTGVAQDDTLGGQNGNLTDKGDSVAATTVSPSSLSTLSSRLLFMGDVFWGRSINKWSQDSDLKYDYPFSGLSTFDRSKYNAWIANLECPITTRIMSPAEQEQGLRFTCLPEYLPAAHKFFDVFSQANNHTDNQEQIGGLKSTREYLEKEGIQYFGSFDNRVTADVCEVVNVEATTVSPLVKSQANGSGDQGSPLGSGQADRILKQVQDDTGGVQGGTRGGNSDKVVSEIQSQGIASQARNDKVIVLIPIAMCGYNNVFSLPSKASLDVISAYSKYFPTIIMPHQGQEYVNKPDSYKIATYRNMIDNGADLVVGAHPHAIQSTEVYKGKLITYSLGNFIFDQQGSKTVTHHAALDVTIDFKDPSSENVVKWLELAKNCQKYKDDCLTQAQNLKLTKPEFNLKYDIIASENEKKVTQKADDKIQEEILKLTNWAKTILDLGQK